MQIDLGVLMRCCPWEQAAEVRSSELAERLAAQVKWCHRISIGVAWECEGWFEWTRIVKTCPVGKLLRQSPHVSLTHSVISLYLILIQ